MDAIVAAIREQLEKQGDETIRLSGQRYFKEPVRMHGLKADAVGKLARTLFLTVRHLPKEEIFRLCGELWQGGFMEESFIACDWSYAVRKKYTPGDFRVFEGWVDRYVNNWASCDTLCNHTVGSFLEMYPEFPGELKRWAASGNRWMRRAAAVSLIVPARKGLFLEHILEIATQLLTDPDDMVQKGYGWMLKAASKPHQEEIFDFVEKNKKRMPRTALRYAIEKMPPHLRQKAMEK